MAGEVTRNWGISISISSITAVRKVSQRNILEFFLLDILKKAF